MKEIHPIIFTENCLKAATDAKENFLQNILKPLPRWINADHLTLLRILCTVPVIFFFLTGKEIAAFWWFAFGAFLDLIDGPIARLQKKESDVGKVIDPLADKILIIITLVIIFIKKGSSFLSPLLLSLMLLFESILFMMGGKAIRARAGLKQKLGANLWGKWKFFFQAIGVSLLILQKPFWAQLILWPAVILAVASIIDHLTSKTPEQI